MPSGHSRCRRFARIVCAVMLSWCASSAGCAAGDEAAPASAAAPAAAPPPAAATAQTPPVDACTLLTQADVESLTGKKTLPAAKDEMPSLVTCRFDDPEAPKLPDGRAVSQILTLTVFTAQEGTYVGGPVTQAKESFETGRRNAATPEDVAGLGDAAFWDKTLRGLHVHKGRYEVSVGGSGLTLTVARAAAEKAVAKLP